MDIRTAKTILIPILRQYGATKISIFGSFARGEQTSDSDLDLLVDFADTKSLLTLVKIKRELSEAIGRDVDLLTEAAVSPYLIDTIRAEQQIIYQ
jgi:predicted nucleotidyltransferase